MSVDRLECSAPDTIDEFLQFVPSPLLGGCRALLSMPWNTVELVPTPGGGKVRLSSTVDGHEVMVELMRNEAYVQLWRAGTREEKNSWFSYTSFVTALQIVHAVTQPNMVFTSFATQQLVAAHTYLHFPAKELCTIVRKVYDNEPNYGEQVLGVAASRYVELDGEPEQTELFQLLAEMVNHGYGPLYGTTEYAASLPGLSLPRHVKTVEQLYVLRIAGGWERAIIAHPLTPSELLLEVGLESNDPKVHRLLSERKGSERVRTLIAAAKQGVVPE